MFLRAQERYLPQQLTTCEGHYVIGLIAMRNKVQSITVCWSGFNGCVIVPATFFFTFILGASSAKLLSIMASISVISQVKSFSWPGGQMMCWEARQSGGHESHEDMLHWDGEGLEQPYWRIFSLNAVKYVYMCRWVFGWVWVGVSVSVGVGVCECGWMWVWVGVHSVFVV